ncbi:ATP-binding protein [Chitinophaga flava]|uniref:ATPase n=1 Tax=Chitinophaga flava TaxID=2259036 RepID=A0A365XQB5_9BACT|nr:ATP-binding protein [Chitinophaga flava]RBL88543.1 ATPase [Chitinophaga flava]
MKKQAVMPAWHFVETIASQTLDAYFEDAKMYGNVFAITGAAGSGKTFAAQRFSTIEPSVIHLECAEHWNRKIFLRKILAAMHKEPQGYNVGDLLDEIVSHLLIMEEPLLILDEADKLSDQVLYFFITLYNLLRGKCGIVMMATNHLVKRMERGRRLNRKGYTEIYSRLGRRIIQLPTLNKQEIISICEANGISDQPAAVEIFHECEGDMRRLEREVHKRKRKMLKQTQK